MILYFDTETTGLRPGNICQISYIMQTKSEVRCKNFFFSVDYVEIGALNVHGFSVEKLRDLSNGNVFSDRIEEIKRDFESADLVVAHNLSFDMMFLREEFLRQNQTLYIKNEMCSMKQTTPVCKILGKRGYKYPKLSELTDYLGVTNSEIISNCEKLFNSLTGFHDARFDCTALYLAMQKLLVNGCLKQELSRFLI